MKKFLVVFATLVMFSCSSDAEQTSVNDPEKDSLEAENLRLKREMDELRDGVDSYAEYFNDVKQTLDSIRMKQGLISEKLGSKERIDKADLLEDLNTLGALMTKNQETINQLKKSVKNSNLQSDQIEKMIMSLTEEVALKNMEIYNLQQELETIDAAYTEVLDAYHDKVEELAQANEQLNTAFFTFGTAKELKDNGVLTKEGGFIGIGKIKRLKNDFNKQYFTEIDVTKTKSIPLGVARAELLTNHPEGSYELVGEKNIEKLVITNAKEFWSVSKYLVIVVE